MFRIWLLIILVTSKSLAANRNEKNWKCLKLAKLRGRREEPSLSKLKSLSDDGVVNYYSTILHREPSAEKSYLSQILNQASSYNFLESGKSKIEVSSTERPLITGTITFSTNPSSLETQNDFVTKSILNKSNQSDVDVGHSASQHTTQRHYTTTNDILNKLSNVSSITVYLGVFNDNLSKFTIPSLPALNKKQFESIKPTTEYTNLKISVPSTMETIKNFTSSQSNNTSDTSDASINSNAIHTSNNATTKNYAPIFLLMAHKFDEIEQNLQTFKANQLFLAHKVKNISDKLETKDGEPLQIIRPDINKIIEKLVNVGTTLPASSYEALSNLTNPWNRA